MATMTAPAKHKLDHDLDTGPSIKRSRQEDPGGELDETATALTFGDATQVDDFMFGSAAVDDVKVKDSHESDVVVNRDIKTDEAPAQSVTESSAPESSASEYSTPESSTSDPSTSDSSSTRPPVWAKTRAALCDALSYFRIHEGGNYNLGGVTYGLLFDSADGLERDYLDGTVIISSVGGRMGVTGKTGVKTIAVDQDESERRYRCLKKSQELGQTVVAIAGDKNKMLTVPHSFCVLGEYQITDLWLEKFPNANGVCVARWMVRLEKVDSHERSWFSAPSDTSHLFDADRHVCPVRKCGSCDEAHKQIYAKGWACLNNKCENAFRLQVGSDEDAEWKTLALHEAEYNPAFLNQRSTIQADAIRRTNLLPSLPTMDNNISFGTEASFKKGIVCPRCRCASRRIFWHGWECENEECDFSYRLETRPYPLTEIEAESVKVKKSRHSAMKYDESFVTYHATDIDGYKTEIFTLPDENGEVCGTAVVLRASEEICAKRNGPNDMFEAMQDPDGDLKLYRSAARLRGMETTSQCGSGAPYKFGVAVDTTAFSDAPEPILRGVAQLSWAQEKSIQKTRELFEKETIGYSKDSMSLKSENFNELLALGYFESSTISYHDDGEKQLGPTVATLSLGSPAVMRFRPKKKNAIGTPGNNAKGEKPAVVTIPLYHGDICIMHGVQLQKNYEHEVKAKGKLRFAMTSRYIRADALKPGQLEETIEKSKLPSGFDKMAYRGITPDGSKKASY
ncbi:hypothetical protein LQW54_009990 [Pestalotiopsis sp. IQ-011]